MKNQLPKIYIRLTLFIVASLIASNNAMAFEWKSIFSKFSGVKSTSLNDTVLASGLREALQVGVDRTVDQLSAENGFLANEAVRINPPAWLEKMDSVLRKFGLGESIDALTVKMNRSAEAAVPHAKSIFIDSIMKLTIDDAQGILKGGDHGITQYFEKTTRNELKERFMPIINESMKSYAVYDAYDGLIQRAQKVPFLSNLNPPTIESYVSDKALDGIYLVLSQQEAEIRNNPERRVTQLLKQTFAS